MITVIENETHISDLATRKKEVVQRTQCVLRKIIDLQKNARELVYSRTRDLIFASVFDTTLSCCSFSLKTKKNCFMTLPNVMGELKQRRF